ncbi:histidinol dehydrogenase [Shewanella oneidensis MR-1]|uniref:Histidinol dehydrogenase n=1 Tax=Shewanella oneidensis (strain ATCC 700550 / JCM 31522 / CIP 106686 / LMG 19005 / NCIMB 14063 / MR-1) TaxID=211586 RepID=HISX_SHEON|nr:histidinol dehydrogenase [Shewanella oneidensis]Q8EFB1.1 RecName: Full=Histidinol dehydrogenase; Short=HDH [Shewanella oneidensis MR-1]AAN55120.1 histidinol dehydrogenase HisD [Shewanella oneidensis MR-1]MDX5996188.1 histidinol dehydrogenase [Shewanella oneidensis]MEE2029920.1 Histidinol dehydrogenase [Shewanella oneidensis]QKG96688.1 histidinol dehydrogenase [Shewanella oneidensis MR-1]
MDMLTWAALSADEQKTALQRSPLIGDSGLEQSVRAIVDAVASRGDAAIKEFNQKFDGARLANISSANSDNLRLSEHEIEAASARVSPELKAAIAQAMANIDVFHSAQQFRPIDIETQAGVRCELRSEPIEKVGLYIPGGSAPLISTVLMLALPATIAGCEQRVLVSPPPINDAIVYAANVCGITEIYQVGGAQAIAALAFGTETIPSVDKIFGPGNRYVTEAKRLVSQDGRCTVSIDMPAGPSEVLVIADSDANAQFIAADLLSQAEHGPDSQVILVTDSLPLAQAVNQALKSQLAALPRQEIAATALKGSRTILVKDMQEAALVSNRYGPEHLIIQTRFPREVLNNIRAAGSVFLGAYTPESVGDYASGTNHVLPTYGYSRAVSSLSLADFSRRFTVQELSAKGLLGLGQAVMTLASNELLDAHKNAVAVRLASLKG